MEPLEIKQALAIITNHVEKGKPSYHKDYDRVVGLAELYKKLITGENIDSLLIRYNPRETEEQFKQRKRITQLVTPAVTEKIKTPFYKVARIDNVKKTIAFTGDDEDANKKATAEINAAKKTFFGDESLDEYMESIYIDDSFTDPNSFLVTEINPVPEGSEVKAKPFPIMYPAKDAINFNYVNNVLRFLVVKSSFKLKTKDGVRDGLELRIYTPNYMIKIKEVADNRDEFEEIIMNEQEFEIKKSGIMTIKKKKFMVTLIEPETEGEIQAIRIGYKRDEITAKRTYVSPMHSALPRMMKSIKATSEMDLTMTLHVHPQKAQYAASCPGAKPEICKNGKTRNGKICTVCNGSGFDKSTSSQEMITLPLPKNMEDMLDLDKMISYKSPPVDLVKWMDDFVKQLEVQAMQDVFTSESFNRIVAPKTLGEKELDMESVYDTLFPFANKYSTVYKKECKMIAIFTDNSDGVIIIHEFPKDFKLKTAKALIADRAAAKTAEVPAYLLQEIDNDLAVKLYANNEKALMEYKIKQQHIPFKGKSDAQIQIAINNRLTPMYDKVLWSNFDAIFENLEADFLNKGESFYELSYDKRVEAIKEETDKYVEEIVAQTAVATSFPTEVIDVEEDGEEEEEITEQT